jgi:hypothetical protein
MNTKTSNNKKRMLEALEKTLGVVTPAAKMININPCTHYEWLKNDPDYAEKVQELENIALDFAESKLHGLINSGDTVATIFYLKSKGKKRGYIEKQQIEHQGQLTINQITGMEIK